ncbi:probable inactive receptor-like protein kinase At3g56050 [Phragmites australis]|uniref:probable inactive receptor-like protein kinase At3g56050 n=1 Tax=Phragmites australis TaxID=29695 RepID=UPI002D789790|nr:probable inactive receptor-like protein kinase At3g56050 [Phragmites australis]
MGTNRRSAPAVCVLFWFLMASELCASLNHEGVALLRFKKMIHVDPYGALLDWDEGSFSPCSWFGVRCSDDGQVTSLNLENLGLKGILSPEIGKLVHMHSLILHNNSFYGIIPTEIHDLKELKMLDLGYNNFSGPVPSDIRNILSLEFLFLKGNRFSGALPVELHELTRICESQDQGITRLNRISAARNVGSATTRRLLASKQKDSLETKIVGSGTPTSASLVSEQRFFAYPPTHFKGNTERPPFLDPRVSPPPSPPPPSPSEPIPPPPVSPDTEHTANQENKSSNSSTVYASIGAAIGFVVVALSAVCFFYYRRRKTSTVVPLSATSSRQLQTTTVGEITLLRLSELEKACEGFSNVIGTLPGCTLYKGTLPCGAEIAVVSTSVAYAGGWSAIAEAHYKNKVEAFSKLDHKNLMNLVGYCEDEEPFTRMMVFEYVSNGSLFEHLHVKEAEHLNWQSRLRIAMGVVYCLDYIYQQNPPVILRNLTSSCIYLTEDNAAKISDISFWHGEKEEEDEVDASDEYNTVYKFALLLLEMISGRRPYSDDDGLLVLWAHRYLTGVNPMMGMVDPTLNSVPDEHVRALSELIGLCISEDRRQRPTMAEVTKRMQEITAITQDQAIPRNSALWWAELEIITS